MEYVLPVFGVLLTFKFHSCFNDKIAHHEVKLWSSCSHFLRHWSGVESLLQEVEIS